MTKRLQLFAHAVQAGELAEKELAPFDSTTLLGRYFRFSIVSLYNKQLGAPLTVQDINTLENDFPDLHAEHQVLTTYLSNSSEAEKITALETLLSHAEAEGWARLVRWLTALLVELEMATGNYGHALFRLYEEIDFAPDIQHHGAHFEYPLTVMQQDMATTLYYLGEYNKSIDYCRMFSDSVGLESEMLLHAKLCEIRAQIRGGDPNIALEALDLLMSETVPTVDSQIGFLTYTLRAETLLELERLDEAKNAGLQAYTLLNNRIVSDDADTFTISQLLAQIHVKLGNVEEAEAFAAVADKYSGRVLDTYHRRVLLRTQGEISEKKKNYENALKIYKDLYSIISISRPILPWKEIETISTEIDNLEIEYLRDKASLDQNRNIVLTVSLTSLLLITLILTILYLRNNKKRTSSLALRGRCHLTNLTELQILTENINSILNRGKIHTLVIVDDLYLSQHPLSLNEKIKLFEYITSSISKRDLIGKYDFKAFLLFFSDTTKEQALEKVKFLLKKYNDRNKEKFLFNLLPDNFVAFECGKDLSADEALRQGRISIEKMRQDA